MIVNFVIFMSYNNFIRKKWQKFLIFISLGNIYFDSHCIGEPYHGFISCSLVFSRVFTPLTVKTVLVKTGDTPIKMVSRYWVY